MDPVAHARLRMLALADPGLRHAGPVAAADLRTSMDDARAALCIAQGVPFGDIDPASGHNLTRAAYEAARAEWRQRVGEYGFSEQYDRPRYQAARDRWERRRPQFTDGDDWLAGLIKPDETTGTEGI